jgi:hypothetical protein
MEAITMEDQTTEEVLEFDEETDIEEEGSFLTTAVVFGVGAAAGAIATKGYGKVKGWATTKMEERRELKAAKAQLDEIEDTDKKKK